MGKTAVKARHSLEQEIQELRMRLAEAEETLFAIRHGEVDALLVETPAGEEIFTLQGADTPYRILIQEMSEGAVTVDQDGTILYANQRFAQLVDRSLEQIFNTHIADYVSLEDRPALAAMLQQVGKGELTLQTAQGALVPAHFSMAAFYINNLQALSLLITDLTAQKKQQDLIGAERLARSILDQAAEGIIVCDLDGQIIQANQAARALSATNPLWQPFDQAYPLQQLNHKHELEPVALSSILDGEVVRSMEVNLPHPGGSLRTFLLSAAPLVGSPTSGAAPAGGPVTGDGAVASAVGGVAASATNGYVVTLTDVSERKQIEEALRLSEDRFRVALQNSPITVYNQDRELRYTWVYPADQNTVLGRTDLELLNSSEATLLMGWKRFVLKTGQPVRSEVELTQRGETRYYDLLIEPLRGAHGEISGITSATIDITSRRLAEEARLQSEGRFRQLFEFSPVALCELDCSEMLNQIQEWRLRGVRDIRQHLAENGQAAAQYARLTRVLDVNQAALELYAATEKAQFALQQNVARLLPAPVLTELMIALANDETQFECEILLRTFQGVEKFVMLRACFLPDQAQQLSLMLVSLVDMTDRPPE